MEREDSLIALSNPGRKRKTPEDPDEEEDTVPDTDRPKLGPSETDPTPRNNAFSATMRLHCTGQEDDDYPPTPDARRYPPM